MAVVFILLVSLCCFDGRDREEPGIAFCVETAEWDSGQGGMAAIASDVQKRFPALAKRWLGRKASLSDCVYADLVFEIGPAVCSAACPRSYGWVTTPLPCLVRKGRETAFDRELAVAVAICSNPTSTVPNGIYDTYRLDD